MDELTFLNWLSERFGVGTSGPGDDCAVLEGNLCITTDSVVEGLEFQEETPSFFVGYKSAAVSLSDLAAMGASAEAVLCAAVLSPRRSEEVDEVVRGLLFACSLVGARLVGGDYAVSNGPSVLTTTAVGYAERPIPRSGARVGMAVAVTGALGGSILGKHLRFRPKIREGRLLAHLGVAAMIDISDGLLLDAARICQASSTGMVLYAEQIPVSAAAKSLARKSGRKPLEHALTDGEDFELLVCADYGLLQKARYLLPPLFIIGEVVERQGLWIGERGHLRRVEPKGYIHGCD